MSGASVPTTLDTGEGQTHGRQRSAAQVRPQRGPDADHLVQHHGRSAGPAAAAAAPRPHGSGRPGRPRPAVPDGTDHAGGVDRAVHRDPRRRPRRVPPVAAVPAVPRAPAGEGAGHAGTHLLQVRGRLAGRLAQDQHLRPAGVLQQEGGDHQADHRDRCRPVGNRPVLRVRALRHRLRGLAGRGVVRRQALPAPHDGGLRRTRPPLAVGPHRRRACARGGSEELVGLTGHRDLGGRRGGRQGPEHAVRPRLGAQPRAAAPDDHRRGGAAPARDGR